MRLKALSKFMSAAFLGGSLLMAGQAEAAIAFDRLPLLTYADSRIPTYDEPGGGEKGFITARVSLVMVKSIRPDGWAYGSYPIAGGKRISRWFRMENLQGDLSFQNYPLNIANAQTVYRTATSESKVGSLLGQEDVLVVGEGEKVLKIIYRSRGGNEYRMGWIDKPPEENSGETPGAEESGQGGYGNHGPKNVFIIQGNVTAGNIDLSQNEDNSINDYSIHDYSQNDNSTHVTTTVNDYSENDYSYNDNSHHSTVINEDNSYNDYSVTRNTKIVDNSNNVSINDNSQTVNNITNENGKPSLKGDINRDGVVGVRDLEIMVRVLGRLSNIRDKNTLVQFKPAAGEKSYSPNNADMNNDGKLNGLDVNLLLQAGADVNKDKVFSQADIALLKEYLSKAKPLTNIKNADFNGDGKLNQEDVTVAEKILAFFNGQEYRS